MSTEKDSKPDLDWEPDTEAPATEPLPEPPPQTEPHPQAPPLPNAEEKTAPLTLPQPQAPSPNPNPLPPSPNPIPQPQPQPYPQQQQQPYPPYPQQPLPFAASPRAPFPIIGTTLSVYGALLWSFVVAGQFTTSWMSGAPMAESTAAVAVFIATITALVLALRRSRVVPMQGFGGLVKRLIAVSFLAGALHGVTILGAAILGNIGRSGHDVLIAMLLITIAVTASIAGPYLAVPVPPARSHGQRFAVIMVWIGVAVVTLVAGVELVATG